MRLRLLLATQASLFVMGCTDLTAVKTISDKMVGATGSWDGVASEYVAACERQRQFDPGIANCDGRKDATEGIKATNKILLNYFKALRDAADETKFTADAGIDSLSGSVGKVPGIKADDVEAITGFAKILVNLFTSWKRERVLRDLIDEAPRAEQVMAVLDRAVPPDLRNVLRAEWLPTNNQFRLYSGGVLALDGSDCPNPLASKFSTEARFVLALEYCRRFAEHKQRLAGVDTYSTSLATVRASLKELQSNKTKLGAKDLAQKLYEQAKALDAAIDKLDKAFGGGDA